MITNEEIKQKLQAVQDTLTGVLDEVKTLNQKADGVVDRGLDAIEKSPYSTPIVASIALAMLAIGWFAHALLG